MTRPDRHEAIGRMVEALVRTPSSRVLLSPDLYDACLEQLRWWGKEFDKDVPSLGDVFVRGVPAVRCDTLVDMEYALVPKDREL